MNRIDKYQESIRKFITTRSCVSNNEDDEFKRLIHHLVTTSDMYGGILLLTAVNAQNKRNRINVHGYDAAAAVEFLSYLIRVKGDLVKHAEYANLSKDDVACKLYSIVLKSVISSTEVAKRALSDNDKYMRIYSQCMTIVANDVPDLSNYEKATKTPTVNDNIYRFYFNKDPELQKKYTSLQLYNHNSLLNRYMASHCRIFQTAISLGWLITGGAEKEIAAVSKVGTLFGLVYRLGRDFEMVDEDLDDACNGNLKTDNYLINCGLQKAYDDYIVFKQQLITLLMTHDLFSKTIREMMDEIDRKVDTFIENSHPDVKSSYSVSLPDQG